MNRVGNTLIKRAAIVAAAGVTALGGLVATSAPSAIAAVNHPVSLSVSCTGPYVYGTSFSCTLTATDTWLISGQRTTPKGTVTLGTLLGRLTGASCTLNPSGTGSSNSCTVTVTPTDTGSMVPAPTAYTATSSHYLLLPVPTLVTVGSAPLSLTADNASRDYGAGNPTFTVTPSGFVNGDDISDLLGTLSCGTTATSSSPVNTYPITCSGLTSKISTIYPLSSTPHYSITWVDGTLTVDKADLAITADNKTRGYGAADPAFTVTYATFLAGDDETDLGGSLSCGTTATPSSPVNTYPITCSGLTSDNYDITWNPGTLTVVDADLVITAENKTRLVGAANPAFTVKYETFQAGDDETDLAGTLDCSTTADLNSPAGDYPIVCTGLTSDNYKIAFVDGTLHVLEAPGGSLPGGSGSYQAGGTVDVEVHDFKPGTTVTVNGCGIVDGEIVIDGNGDGHGTFTVPADMDSTTCELTITGTDNTDGPADVVLSMAVLGLVPTGSSSQPLGVAAGLTIVLGFGLVLLGRRRHAWR